MRFENAHRYKLKQGNDTKYFNFDELTLFIHKHNLSYRYVPRSEFRGTLELFNDLIDLTFDVILYAK